MRNCEAYIKGKRCGKVATYLSGYFLYAPDFPDTSKMVKIRLCKSCAEERLNIKGYPWKIEKITNHSA